MFQALQGILTVDCTFVLLNTTACRSRFVQDDNLAISWLTPEANLNEPVKSFWPRTIWDFFALQLRIGLSLVILVPIFSNWEKLTIGTSVLLLVCFAPILALIFIVNRTTLLWTLFLLLFSALGGAIGLLIARATGSPFNTYYSGKPRYDGTSDDLLCAIIVAIVFWWVAVKIKSRFDGSAKKQVTRDDVEIVIAESGVEH